jgi:hypothetical protein
VNHGDRSNVRQEILIKLPGVGGHLQDDGVFFAQGSYHPFFQASKFDPLRTKNLLEVFVHTDGDQEFFMNVEADEAFGLGVFLGHAFTPLQA